MTVTPTAFVSGAPFAATVTGTGCVGGQVSWRFGDYRGTRDASRFAEGNATPDGAGSWQAQPTGEVRELNPYAQPQDEPYAVGPVDAWAVCQFPGGHPVIYGAVPLQVLAPDAPSTTTTSAAVPGSTAPRFAG